MTLTELRYIVALAQTQHFGRAAKHCCVSQPTLSVGIRKIEERLGVAIFERRVNEVCVTEMGQAIIAQAQRVLEESAKLVALAEKGKNQLNHVLRIGAIFTIAPYLFPLLVPAIKQIAPEMPLSIVEDYTSQLKTKLINGQLDAVIIALPFTETGVLTRALYEEPFVLLMRKDHPLSQEPAVSAKQIKNENVLLLGEGHCFRSQILEACPSCLQQGTTQQAVEGTSLETLRHMVASGLGMTVLPSSATQVKYYDKVLCTKPFKDVVPQRTVALAWRDSFPRPKAISALLKAMHHIHPYGTCMLPEIC